MAEKGVTRGGGHAVWIWGRTLLVALAAGALCAVCASAASANSETCGVYKVSYFDGYGGTLYQGASEGAYGTISLQNVSECNGATTANDSMAWVMIASPNNGGYVQSGYIHGYEQCPAYFSQTRQTNSESPQSKFGGCLSLDGSTHDFNEQYGSGCGCEYAKIDGTVWQTTTWNPFSNWSSPFNPEFFGEAYYRESDMPGSPSSPTKFGSLHGQNNGNNDYYAFGCTGFLGPLNNTLTNRADGNKWYLAQTSCPEFEIYTGPR